MVVSYDVVWVITGYVRHGSLNDLFTMRLFHDEQLWLSR